MSAGNANLVYTITLQPKGQEQISAADRLLQQLYSTLQKGGQSIAGFTQGFTRGTQEVATSTQKVTQSSQQLVTSINAQKTAYQGTTQQTNTYKQALDQTAASQSRMGQQSKTLEAGINAQKTAFTGAVGSMNQYKTTTDQVFTSQGKLVTSYQQTTQQVNLYKQAQQQSLSTMQQTKTVTDQAVVSHTNMKTSIVTLTGSIAALGGSLAGLYNSWDAMGDAMLEVEKKKTAYMRTQDALSTLQYRYNLLIEKEGANSERAGIYLQKINTYKTDLANKIGDLENAQEKYNESVLSFYTTLAPQMITAVGSITAGVSSAIPLFNRFRTATTAAGTAAAAASGAQGIGAVGPAATQAGSGLVAAGAGATAAKGGMAGLAAVAGPLVLVIGAIAAAVGAVHFNFLGFRDVLNNVGKGLGDLLPITRGTLDMIKGLTGQIGISGEKTEEWQKALDRGFEDLQMKVTTISKAVETALNEIGYAFQDTYIFFENFAQLGSIIGKGIGDAITEITKFGAEVKKSIDQGLAFLSDPNTWVGGWNAFVELAGSAGENAMKLIQQKINEFGRWVFGDKQWENLVTGALDAANNSVKVIQQTLSGVASWIDETIIQPAASAIQKNIIEPLSKASPSGPSPQFQSYLDDTYFRQTVEAQKKTAFGKPLNETLTELSGTPVVPAPKQTAPEIPFGVAGKPPAESQGVFAALSNLGEQIFSDDSREKLKAGTVLVENVTGAVTALTQPVQQASGAMGEAANQTGKAGTATKTYNRELEHGKEKTQAYNDAIIKQFENTQKAETALAAQAGTLAQLKAELASGEAQVLAFGQGYAKAAESFLKMQVATADVQGQVKFLSDTLTTQEGIVARTESGWANASKAVYEWAGNMDVAKGAAMGTEASLVRVADKLGVAIPEGFRGSSEALKQFIALTKQAGPEFESMINQVTQGYESLTSGLTDAIRGSNDDFNDAIDELEEKLGVKFNKGVRDALKLDASSNVIGDLSNEFTMLFSGIANNIDASDFFDLRDQFKESIQENLEDIPKELRPQAEAIVKDLMDALNAPVDLDDPASVKAYIAGVQAELVRLDGVGNSTADTWKQNVDDMNATSFDPIIEKIGALKEEIFSIGGAWDQVKSAAQSFNLEETATPVKFDPSLGSPDPNSDPTKNPLSGNKNKKAAGAAAGTAIDLTTFQANLDEARSLFATFMTGLAEDAALIPTQVMAAISPLPGLMGETFLAIRDGWTGMVSLMVADAQAISTGLIAAFEAAKEPIGETLVAIRDAATGAFTLIISDAQALGPGISAGFSAARTQSQPHISGLSEDFASLAVTPIESMASGIADTIGSAFEDGATRAETALGGIETAAENVTAAVNEIATAINNLPDEKTITINIVTNGSVPSGLASGFEGVVNGPVQFTAGEAGPEIVSVIPLTRPFTGPGSKKGGAAGFGGNDGVSRIAAASGFSGVVGADAATYRHGNLEGQPPPNTGDAMMNVNIAGVGGRPVSSVGGILGGIPVTIVSGNSGWTMPGGGFGLPGGGGGGGGGGSSGGGGSTGGGGGGGTGGGSNIIRQVDVNENGQRLFYYQNGTNIQTNMNAEQIARYVGPTSGTGGTPTTPPTGGGGGGTGGGGTGGGGTGTGTIQPQDLQALKFPSGDQSTYASISAPSHLTYGPPNSGRYVGQNADRNRGPEDWFIKKQSNGKFKIVNGLGQDIAVDFDSVNDAQQWINWQIQEIERRNPGMEVGSTTLPLFKDKNTGKVYSQDDAGNLYLQNMDFSDYVVDPDTTAEPIRWQPGGGGGGGTTTGGGGWQHGAGNVNPQAAPYNPSTIQTSGNGAIWQGANQDPNTWRVVPMVNFPDKWKVVDNAGKNIAAGFDNEDQAETYIFEYQAIKNGNPPGGQTTGGGGAGVPNNPPPSGGGGSPPGYTPPAGIQTSGSGARWSGADPNPDHWQVVPMQDDPSKYKVVDANGKNVAARFDNKADAEYYIQQHRNQYLGQQSGSPNNPPPMTGGGTTGGNTGAGAAGTLGPGGPDYYNTVTGYSVPGYVKTAGHGGTSDKWRNPNMDPRVWKAEPMTSADKQGLWKVVDDKGVLIATEFKSQAEAQEFIDEHVGGLRINGQPVGGGGTGTGGTGTGGTPTSPPPTTGGGGGSGNQDIQINENGQQLYYRNQNGVVTTNMTPAQIARYVGPAAPGAQPGGTQGPGTGTGGTGGPNIGGMQFPPGFPFGPDTPIGPGGGPVIGGIEFPPGFPFHNTPGAFPGGQPGGGFGFPPGLVGGFGLPYGPVSPRVQTDVSIPSGFMGFSGSGYLGTEAGAGGVGRPPWVNTPTFMGPIFGPGLEGIPGGNPNVGSVTNTGQGITQTQSWNQSSQIVSGGSIVGRGNNINIRSQTNNRSNVFGQGSGGFGNFFGPIFGNGGGGSSGGGAGSGNALAGGQYYDSWVVENAEGTERHPEFRSNMNSTQMARLIAMMQASGQEIPYYTTGQPAITGFRYNGSGWQGSRPVPTARQLRTGRDNMDPIWDTGRAIMPSDIGMRAGPNMGISGNIGGGNPLGGWLGGLEDLIDKLTDNILGALQSTLAKMAININLNNSSIGDMQTRLMMRRISGGF